MPDPLSRVPMALVQGTSVSWRWEDSDFNPADGWALIYAFEGPSPLNVAGVADGTGFLVSLTTVQTAGLGVGFYRWQAFAARSVPSVERVQVAAGALEVVLDLLVSTASTEQKSHARRMVEALEAALEGRATDGQKSMSINGRSIERIPILELSQLLATYRQRLRAEEAAEAQGATPGKRRRIKVRF